MPRYFRNAKKAPEYIQIKAVRAPVKVLEYSTVFHSSLLPTPTADIALNVEAIEKGLDRAQDSNLGNNKAADKAADEDSEYK